MALYVELKQYTAAVNMASRLLGELKKIDDKALLVEVNCFNAVSVSLYLLFLFLNL